MIKRLRELGVRKTVMLTGDSERTAAAIAAQVGVDEYHAEVLPEDKAHFVEEERAAGHTVIMLGDGINDSPALSAANVGIAISDGAAIAREIADVTIAAENLFELVTLRQLSSSLMNRIHSNYRFVIGFNGSLIVLGAAGILLPAHVGHAAQLVHAGHQPAQHDQPAGRHGNRAALRGGLSREHPAYDEAIKSKARSCLYRSGLFACSRETQ